MCLCGMQMEHIRELTELKLQLEVCICLLLKGVHICRDSVKTSQLASAYTFTS